jgi:formylmethanofuran dehydrogenase subunit E
MMLRLTLCCGFLAITTACFAHDPGGSLPESQYQRNASDPTWLRQVARFHGHLGPMVVVGARMGMAGVHAVEAKGYFDVEVTCEGPFAKPPGSCFLDGVQVATGATLGKRAINTVDAEKIVLRVRNTETGKTAEVRPTQKLLDVLASLRKKPDDDQQDDEQTRKNRAEQRVVETARSIATMPDKDILTVTQQ